MVKQGGALRRTKFTAKVADEICRRLSTGESLNHICEDEHLPSEAAVRSWALDNVEGFSSTYQRARALGAHRLFDEIIELADAEVPLDERGRVDHGAVQQRRLQVDARKFYISKVLPKIYGDKLELSGDPDRPVASNMSDEEITARIEGILAKARERRRMAVEHQQQRKRTLTGQGPQLVVEEGVPTSTRSLPAPTPAPEPEPAHGALGIRRDVIEKAQSRWSATPPQSSSPPVTGVRLTEQGEMVLVTRRGRHLDRPARMLQSPDRLRQHIAAGIVVLQSSNGGDLLEQQVARGGFTTQLIDVEDRRDRLIETLASELEHVAALPPGDLDEDALFAAALTFTVDSTSKSAAGMPVESLAKLPPARRLPTRGEVRNGNPRRGYHPYEDIS